MNTIESLERQKAEELVRIYQERGYEVVREPQLDWLPPHLADHRPDLLLRKGDQTIVMEVKARASLAKDPAIPELADLIRNRPGWRLDLVLVEPDEVTLMLGHARSLTDEEIARASEEARRLVRTGSPEAGLLLAWSTAEAMLRRIAAQNEIEVKSLLPTHLLKDLVVEGPLFHEDYYALLDILKVRNAVAHGFKPESFDPSVVESLLQVVERLSKTASLSPH
ncbi:MAG TPA: hypothetical protein VMW27_12125 [Thermoanaerobaculia bacterium]|nr:hypothetical protein [Thermoanaerobaculia bacterium]